MKTIYNYKPTVEELIRITGNVWDKENYLKVISHPQTAYIDLWKLFLYRKDPENAGRYFNMIKPALIRRELMNIDWEI